MGEYPNQKTNESLRKEKEKKMKTIDVKMICVLASAAVFAVTMMVWAFRRLTPKKIKK